MSVFKEKIIDRAPVICAAGKVIKDSEHVRTVMKDYSLADKVNAIKHDANVYEEERKPPFTQKPRNIVNRNLTGIYTESRPLLNPPQKTSYQLFLNELYESNFDDTWNKVIGKTRDPFKGNPPALPSHVDPRCYTFGAPTITLATVKELVNPQKSPEQIIHESKIGHELYIKSHNDYDPEERISRSYNSPYDPKKTCGISTKPDPRGIMVKCATQWFETKPVVPVNVIQQQIRERTQPQLGKSLEPCENYKRVPRNHTYGKPCKRELYGMEELLKDSDVPPSLFKRDFHEAMECLNQIRRNVKKRFNKFDFDLKILRNRIAYYDKDSSGWTSLDFLYKMCECYHIYFDHTLFEPLMELIGVLKNGYINYDAFIDLIDINKSVPELVKINDVPKKNQYYETTYQAMQCDRLTAKVDKSPHIRSISEKPIIRAELENLGDETSAAALVNPSVFTNYGLSHRDLFEPTKPEIMKRLFENCGYQFPDDTFEKIWHKGVELDNTGLVCIDTFRKLLHQCVPPSQLREKKEKECFLVKTEESTNPQE